MHQDYILKIIQSISNGWNSFLRSSANQIVHSHIDAMSYLPLKAAKKAGVPVRIAHSHNTSIDKDFKYILKQYFRSRITSVATDFCTCGGGSRKIFIWKCGVYVDSECD